mgnify:CR=1 FL=1
MGIYDKAIEYLEEAQSLSNKLGHVGDEKHSLDLLGQCCLRTGNFERAVECFAKVLEFVRLEGKASKEMEILNLPQMEQERLLWEVEQLLVKYLLVVPSI